MYLSRVRLIYKFCDMRDIWNLTLNFLQCSDVTIHVNINIITSLSQNLYFSLYINLTIKLWSTSVLRNAVSYCDIASTIFQWKTTVKSCTAKEFALYNKVTDSYHVEYITCIRGTTRFHAPRRENINTLDISAASIAYVHDTDILNWFTRESCDKNVGYNFPYFFRLCCSKSYTRRIGCTMHEN